MFHSHMLCTQGLPETGLVGKGSCMYSCPPCVFLDEGKHIIQSGQLRMMEEVSSISTPALYFLIHSLIAHHYSKRPPVVTSSSYHDVQIKYQGTESGRNRKWIADEGGHNGKCIFPKFLNIRVNIIFFTKPLQNFHFQ